MRLKYLNRIVSYIAVSALFSATAVNAAPSSEEMWQTIQEQQKVIEQLQEQIDGYTEEDLSLIESQARFKYGLIKDGEVFYQIKTIVETDNVAESSESAL